MLHSSEVERLRRELRELRATCATGRRRLNSTEEKLLESSLNSVEGLSGQLAAQRHEAEQRSKMARTMPSPGGAGAGQIDLSDASIHAFLELNFEAVGNLAALLDERDEAEQEKDE